jgi:diadenosine tetraphosphate (Ap4A) HIT family hydrolase
MLMMVDRNVHFHVIPRYSEPRRWAGVEFADAGWPEPPQLGGAVQLSHGQVAAMVLDLGVNFR